MIKKSASRNQRSKGLRVKHVLQICVLLAICFWLIYQVKHSRDKRKEFDAEVSVEAESVDGILKLGRKDLPRIEDVHKSEKHEEEEETLAEEEDDKHEEQQDEELSKHEEEDQEEANKHEEDEQEEVNRHDEEEREDGDDEIDENEQEKAAGQANRVEDFVDEEKREEENEEKEGQEENENSSNDKNQEGGGRNTHGAREEHYKADDASSAVSPDVQIIGTEDEKLGTENSIENSTINIMGAENEANKTEETTGHENNLQLKSEEKHTEGGSSLNNTTAEEKDHEISLYNSENHLHPNATKAADSNDLARSKVSTDKPAVVNTETLDSVQNGVATISVSTESQNTTEAGVTTVEQSNLQSIELERANNMSSSSNQLDANTTVATKTENAEAATLEIIKLKAIAEGGNSSESLTTKETTGATQNENSEGNHGSGGTDESSDLSSANTTVDESQLDPIDISDSTFPQDEKDTRVDLSTLPDTMTEVSNTDDAAAE